MLVTCGPTWVAVDRVRVLSNQSTGEMGHRIAKQFQKEGAKVTLLEGPVTHRAKLDRITVKQFMFFNELDHLIQHELKKCYDVIIHAAAVSDYTVKNPGKNKIRSGKKNLTITLIPAPKIINRIKKKNKAPLLVGFKLEPNFNRNQLKARARKLFTESRCNFVVANGTKGHRYTGFILNNKNKILAKGQTRQAIAGHLVRIINLELNRRKN